MNIYQFEQIVRRMAKRFGKMKNGEEADYVQFLFPLESNILKAHRNHENCTSMRLEEGIYIALHKINSYFTKKYPETEPYENPENLIFAHAILMTYDPFTNPEIKKAIEEKASKNFNLEDPNDLEILFTLPVRAIIRVCESVKLFERSLGHNGYFIFIKSQFDKAVPHDEEYNFVSFLHAVDSNYDRIKVKFL